MLDLFAGEITHGVGTIAGGDYPVFGFVTLLTLVGFVLGWNSFAYHIYFQRKDKKFEAGFRMGWTTTDHFQTGVFVGTSFDMPER